MTIIPPIFRYLQVSILIFTSCTYTFSQKTEWAKAIGGNGFDLGSSVATDAQGNVIVVGSFQNTVDFDPSSTSAVNLESQGGYDAFVAKISSEGNLIWAKSFGWINSDQASFVEVDNNGNVFVAGGYEIGIDFHDGNGAIGQGYGYDVFMLKLSPLGDIIWTATIGGQYNEYIGGIDIDHVGNVYATGYFESGCDFDPGPDTFWLYSSGGYNMFVCKFNSDGEFVWAKGFGGSSLARGHGIVSHLSGDVYVTGSFKYNLDFNAGQAYNFNSYGSSYDAVIFRLTEGGEFVKAQQIGGQGDDRGLLLTQDQSGDIFACGEFNGVAQFQNGISLTTNGFDDVYIGKLDSDLNYEWLKGIGGSDIDRVSSVVADQSGDVLLSGAFRVVADFDPGVAEHTMLSNGGFDGFILRLDSSGVFQGCSSIGEYGDDGLSINLDQQGSIVCTGYFSGRIMPHGIELESHGTLYDVMVLKFDSNIITSMESHTAEEFEIVPNPSQGYFELKGERFSSLVRYSVFDGIGNVVLIGVLNQDNPVIDVQHLPDGHYLIRIEGSASNVFHVIKTPK